MNFQKFIQKHCRKLRDSKTAEFIYREIIWNEENRIRMAEFSDNGICAMAAVVALVEECCQKTDSDLNLKDYTVRKVIGHMVAEALLPLGYLPLKEQPIPKKYFVGEFKNAKIYALTGIPKERIAKKIEKI